MGDPYEQYYYRQAYGSGIPVFHGIAIQRGHGLGNLLNAGLRMLLPGIKSVGKAVLNQGLSTGANILSDVLGGESVKTAAKRRAVEGGQNLMNRALAQAGLVGGSSPAKRRRTNRRKMVGRGLKRKRRSGGMKRRAHSVKRRRGVKRAGGGRRKRSGCQRRRRRRRQVGQRKRRVVLGGGDIFS